MQTNDYQNFLKMILEANARIIKENDEETEEEKERWSTDDQREIHNHNISELFSAHEYALMKMGVHPTSHNHDDVVNGMYDYEALKFDNHRFGNPRSNLYGPFTNSIDAANEWLGSPEYRAFNKELAKNHTGHPIHNLVKSGATHDPSVESHFHGEYAGHLKNYLRTKNNSNEGFRALRQERAYMLGSDGLDPGGTASLVRLPGNYTLDSQERKANMESADYQKFLKTILESMIFEENHLTSHEVASYEGETKEEQEKEKERHRLHITKLHNINVEKVIASHNKALQNMGSTPDSGTDDKLRAAFNASGPHLTMKSILDEIKNGNARDHILDHFQQFGYGDPGSPGGGWGHWDNQEDIGASNTERHIQNYLDHFPLRNTDLGDDRDRGPYTV